VSDLFDELAEALQATEAYLAAGRQQMPRSEATDDLYNAAIQLRRALTVFHQLRAHSNRQERLN
jgi:hypothetical protein